MEKGTQIAKRNRAKWLRRAGLILGIVGAGVGSLTSLLSLFAAIQLEVRESLETDYAVFSWLMHWAVLLVARKWALVGGVLLILDSSLLATFMFLGHQWFLLNVPWFRLNVVPILFLSVFLLLLMSGILFILSWREGRKHGEA